MKTTGNIEIPDGATKEAQLLYLHVIVSLIDDHNIPASLILNLDQTKLKYISSANHTLAKKGSNSIGIAGSDGKRCITGTFTVSLKGFLPMRLIYGGKANQSPRQENNIFCKYLDNRAYKIANKQMSDYLDENLFEN